MQNRATLASGAVEAKTSLALGIGSAAWDFAGPRLTGILVNRTRPLGLFALLGMSLLMCAAGVTTGFVARYRCRRGGRAT